MWSEESVAGIAHTCAWLENSAGLQEVIVLIAVAAFGSKTASNKGTTLLILEVNVDRDLKFLS